MLYLYNSAAKIHKKRETHPFFYKKKHEPTNKDVKRRVLFTLSKLPDKHIYYASLDYLGVLKRIEREKIVPLLHKFNPLE